MLLPPAFGFSPHPPVSVFGTGTVSAIAAFLGTLFRLFATLLRSASRLHLMVRGFSSVPATPLTPGFPFPARLPLMRPRSSVIPQCRNLCLLPIGCALRPRLRSRLPRGRSALPRNPWISGQEDSHLFLATHSGILSSRLSTFPFSSASSCRQCSPTSIRFHVRSLASAVCFSPGHFRRRASRLVSCYALF